MMVLKKKLQNYKVKGPSDEQTPAKNNKKNRFNSKQISELISNINFNLSALKKETHINSEL